MEDRAHVIQVTMSVWLVVDGTLRPRFLIRHGPAVHRETHETHMMYRVTHWTVEAEYRRDVGWHDELRAATEWCREQIETPTFLSPERSGYGIAVTVEEQKRRWDAGLDPYTGRPRG